MAKKNNNTNNKETALLKRVGSEIRKINDLANSLVNTVRGNNITGAEKELDRITDNIQDIIHTDFTSITDVSRRKSMDMYSLLTGGGKNTNNPAGKIDNTMDLKDFFEADDGALLEHFKQRHRNRAVYLDDLHVVSTQMHELGVALNTTRDSIVTSDNLSSVVSRDLLVSNYKVSDSLDDDKASLIERIEDLEERYDLHNKIKDHIVPHTLRFGTYYAYTIPYSELFQEMDKRRNENYRNRGNRSGKGKGRGDIGLLESLGSTMESSLNTEAEPRKYDSVIESTILNNIPAVTDNDTSTYNKDDLVQTSKDILDSITIDNEPLPPFLLEEDLSLEQVMEVHAMKRRRQERRKERHSTKVDPSFKTLDKHEMVQDGSHNMNNKFIVQSFKNKQSETPYGTSYDTEMHTKRDLSGKGADYSDVQGAYLKLLDTRRVIPIKAMDEVIGYYYIHRDESVTRRRTFSGGFNIEMTNIQSMSMEEDFMGRIAEQIADNVSLSFLKKNEQFKEAIAKALIYNDAYRRNIHFQFIPAEYIQEFKVNEDAEGEGQSMLKNSVFYAKLYLALLLFKIMIIISRSADQRLLYVRSSGMDTNIGNRIQSVAREFKRKEMSFTDLMSYNAISTKVGQGLDMYIPLGTQDQRGIDFEILPGQDVQLHTELLELLRNSAIVATDTPTPLVDTVQQVDFARQISQSNIKHTSRVISYQSSFNRDITNWYKMLMRADGSFTDAEIDTFKYALLQPSSLNTTNLQEIANTVEAVTTSIVEYGVGRNSEHANSEDGNELKDIISKMIIEDISPSMMASFNRYLEEAKIVQSKNKNERKRRELESKDGDGGDNYND